MRQFFSSFFLFILVFNVVLPLTPLVQKEHFCTLCEFGADDADEENSKEKGEGKSEGKEIIPDSGNGHTSLDDVHAELIRSTLLGHEKRLVSSLYSFRPERPPEL